MLTSKNSSQIAYSRHEPENSILYRTLQQNIDTFIATAQRDPERSPLPFHVYREVDAYLGCGILAKGFVRIQCGSCKHERLVPFSCKKRGFCPSCGGRRMNEVAMHMVDKVFPKTPVRQWVLSFPFSVRYALAYNPELITKVLSIYMRIISNWCVKAARKNGIKGKTAAITFIQRFGSALNLNVHFHSLFVDGVFAFENGTPTFVPVFPPSDKEIATLVQRINKRVTGYLERRGYELNDFSEDPFAHEQPVLAQIAGASIQNRIGVGERAGLRVRKIGADRERNGSYVVGPRCAISDGFSLHANVRIKKRDRHKLEKLIRYTARPPIALDRMSETPDGKILYKLKTQYSDGTTHVLFDPLELVEKVVALVPPPRANLLRYHGLFAPNSKLRRKIIPEQEEKKEKLAYPDQPKWAELLKRAFAIDVLKCPHCGGKMKLLATIQEPESVKKFLDGVGIPSEVPKKSPSRGPPQRELWVTTEPDEFSQISTSDIPA